MVVFFRKVCKVKLLFIVGGWVIIGILFIMLFRIKIFVFSIIVLFDSFCFNNLGELIVCNYVILFLLVILKNFKMLFWVW